MVLVPRNAFGKKLRELRERDACTRAELSALTGLSIHTIRDYERGRRRPSSWGVVANLTAALDLSEHDSTELHVAYLGMLVPREPFNTRYQLNGEPDGQSATS